MGIPLQPQQVATAVAQPLFMTSSGMPILDTAQVASGARTEYDGWSGIKSCDPCLQTDVNQLMLFFNTYNSRPLIGVRVHGWHRERRSRRRRVEDGDGKHHYETEHYWVTVTDFDYKIDISSFVFPFGFIQSVDEKGLTVPELFEKYVNDTNLLKSIGMTKQVDFDFRTLESIVHGYIRQMGWRRGLTISFPSANTTVRVYSKNCLSGMWENTCCNLLCHLTILPCIVMRLYRGDCCLQSDHAEGDIRSFYRIQYAPLQVFESIRPRLWCPGFSGAALAMELMRDLFW
mmetsp:Transcript_50477/g.113418  ORF Transcript_50477/g.113418 Transcript_50477/m.113418 type:complete len:288 (-) Transcript_50477:282-1145(-)